MAMLDDLRREYEAGATIYELSQRYGVGATGIYRRLRKAGATIRPRGCQPKSMAVTERVISLKRAGLLNKKIAHELGMQPSAVCNRLIRAGVRTYKNAGL